MNFCNMTNNDLIVKLFLVNWKDNLEKVWKLFQILINHSQKNF
jgi:hypothetical protein